ncbi:deoxyribodipyrimidine photolyase [Actimicrobium sp. GrIS 1.19]|nr:deoxyribodipyrimidine photolyase [Actimicrobium sp. GrIS 1.19]
MLSYNPVKQAQDLDPTGEFVRRWIPVLVQVSDIYIFEPWKMPAAVQASCGVIIGEDYPRPIVDHIDAGRRACERVSSAHKNRPATSRLTRPAESLQKALF